MWPKYIGLQCSSFPSLIMQSQSSSNLSYWYVSLIQIRNWSQPCFSPIITTPRKNVNLLLSQQNSITLENGKRWHGPMMGDEMKEFSQNPRLTGWLDIDGYTLSCRFNDGVSCWHYLKAWVREFIKESQSLIWTLMNLVSRWSRMKVVL